jgi:uncharacterized protein YkwD
MNKIKKLFVSSIAVASFMGCANTEDSVVENSILVDTPDEITSDFKVDYLEAINNARSQSRTCGSEGYFEATTALLWNDKLYGAAYEHSNDMALTNNFSHDGSGQASDLVGLELGRASTVGDRIEAYGYEWQRYAENIGAGTDTDTAEKIVNQLLDSAPHCANIMNPLLKEVAMAMVKNSNSDYVYYWTQDFGTSVDSE